MSALSRKLRRLEGDRIAFWCPGCETAHMISVAAGGWVWNGNPDLPTFAPSVLSRRGHYVPEWGNRSCYCNSTMPDGSPWEFKCQQCHSFVTDGRIQFLSDCTHTLANQTVDLPDWDAEMEGV